MCRTVPKLSNALNGERCLKTENKLYKKSHTSGGWKLGRDRKHTVRNGWVLLSVSLLTLSAHGQRGTPRFLPDPALRSTLHVQGTPRSPSGEAPGHPGCAAIRCPALVSQGRGGVPQHTCTLMGVQDTVLHSVLLLPESPSRQSPWSRRGTGASGAERG